VSVNWLSFTALIVLYRIRGGGEGTGAVATHFVTGDVLGGCGSYRGFRHNKGIVVTLLNGRFTGWLRQLERFPS
jgi:hypothetical protein